jgi:hypothetical protein
LEPEKCDSWEWVPYGAIPEPRFLPLQLLLDGPYRPAGLPPG